MLKRLIIGLFVISLVALLWPAASAQAGSCTGWQQGRDPNNPSRWCYWCPTGYKQIEGEWVECGYCAAWWGGSNFMGLEATRLDSNKCKQDGVYKDCGLVIGAITGTVPTGGQDPVDCEDPFGGCGTRYVIACCPKGHIVDPDKCKFPGGGGGQGWPHVRQGIVVAADSLEDVKKKNIKTILTLDPEEDICPSKRMQAIAVAYEFNGWTCMFPNGYDIFDEDTGEYRACAEWNSERDKCVEFTTPDDYYENPALTALYCEAPEGWADTWEPPGTTLGFGPEGEGGPNQGECLNLKYPDEITHPQGWYICHHFLNNLPESELPWVYEP
jgi:hypothetical protein